MKVFSILTSTVILGLAAACAGAKLQSDAAKSQQMGVGLISVSDAEAIFDYAYPLVLMKISQDLMLTAPMRPHTTPNHFIHFSRLAQPEQRAVVLGNRNTLYSVGWLDLSEGPVLFEIPDMGDRYYVMPLLDAWTNTFESLGSRTTGQGAQKYIIANSNFVGEVPDDYSLIVSPTNMVWITGRIQADSKDDAKEVAALQRQFALTTLQERQTGLDPFENFIPRYNFAQVGLPVPYSLQMEASEFYDAFFELWGRNGSPATDQEIVNLMMQAGITIEQTTRFSDLSRETQDVLRKGLKSKQTTYLNAFYDGGAQTEGWLFNIDPAMGNWGIEFERRAYWAMWGLGTNVSQDAVYGVTQLDSDLSPLNGSNSYRIRFESGELPPTNAFWSVTNYDAEGYLERNIEDRYSLGSNHQLHFNDDGSLDFILSNMMPSGDNVNWVPAPEGDFKTLLRIYWPKDRVLEGNWMLPEIEKLKP